jgi:porin
VLPGAVVKIRAETRYGESVNKFAGPITPASTDGFFPLSADDIPFTITDVTYYQFLSEHFGVYLGKFDTLDGDPNPFASGRGNTQFLNSSFVFPVIGAIAVPYSTLGVGVIVSPRKDISIVSAIMNTADASTTTGFGDIGDGWTWSTEADFQYSLGRLPGGQNVGFVYAADAEFFDYSGRFTFQPGVGLVPPTANDTWALYWSGWQYLYTVEDVESPIALDNGVPPVQGFGLFARAGIGDDDTNPIEWTVSGGFGGQGVIPGRDHDLFGIGYSYAGLQTNRLTGSLGFHDNSQAFEAFYSLAITPAAQLTFDLQVVRGPAPLLDAAVILGMRLYLDF